MASDLKHAAEVVLKKTESDQQCISRSPYLNLILSLWSELRPRATEIWNGPKSQRRHEQSMLAMILIARFHISISNQKKTAN